MSTPAKLKLAVAALALSASGLAGLKVYEGKVLNAQGQHVAYLDTGNVVTSCYGHTKTARMGKTYSEEVCSYLLKQDVSWAEAAIKQRVRVPLSQGQYDSLVSFVFNVGDKQFASSTLLKQLNAGNCFAAAAQFDRWVYDNGVRYQGLAVRRAHERKLFETGC